MRISISGWALAGLSLAQAMPTSAHNRSICSILDRKRLLVRAQPLPIAPTGRDVPSAIVLTARAAETTQEELDIRTKMSDIRLHLKEVGMAKRDSFLAELRDEAKARGLSFKVSKRRGTTVPHREIDPKTAQKIRKGLGLT